MITEIHMENVASFKQATSLQTDKRINLVYGLNGVGKSTISNYLYNSTDERFSQCNIKNPQQLPIMVYNQKFIQDNFFEQDRLKGIFSLSKENKEAEEKISKAIENKKQLETEYHIKIDEKKQLNDFFQNQKKQAIDKTWEIRTQYSGADRTFNYCLKGLMGEKEKLFEYITQIRLSEPIKTLEQLKKEVELYKDDNTTERTHLSKLTFDKSHIENSKLFSAVIMGNKDSEVAALIDSLENTDWVKQGLKYLSDDNHSSEAETCPFCQEKTITSDFRQQIYSYFDTTYQSNIANLERYKAEYDSAIKHLPSLDFFTKNEFSENYLSEITKKYTNLTNILTKNLHKIEGKIKNPKTIQTLVSSSHALTEFNQILDKINSSIDSYNNRLQDKKNTLENLKKEFWSIMRWQYDQTLSRFEQDKKQYEQNFKTLEKDIFDIEEKIKTEKQNIADAQRETINTDDAVVAINSALLDLGIDSFTIIKHSDSVNQSDVLYKVVRENSTEEDTFHSLSEGEKMMISFLYFCELCKGTTTTEDSQTSKIIVIDDPISSLSHIFVFNVGKLIENFFFKKENETIFPQIFVLTHSLYFFYELTYRKEKERNAQQKLFRISKSPNGSNIQLMEYTDIQNDYQAYWNIIKDSNQHPALIANCMRNIIEYFFNFVGNKKLYGVFKIPELQTNRFQAFYRYMDRESHSDGQNLMDWKEFDYDTFKEGFKLVFEEAGYLKHFETMFQN